ncbi:hypothetical protein EG327_002181 [Venturia inaequalis]|uniref:Uncharacterized protein n=1 Tax=Venturia inaequalis TaxID=5025 RepID=A0A8H3VJ85_VENIN|nr:hypothetical protein EG327_002181 [Venturia inaequalis]
MQFPKLTPLQARLAACLGTSIILVVLYYSVSPSHFAYAAELESILNEDHNHHRIDFGQERGFRDVTDWGEDEAMLEEDAFAGVEEGGDGFGGVARDLVRRAPGTSPLKNNIPFGENIAPGAVATFKFARSEVYGPPGTLRTGLPENTLGPGGSSLEKRDGASTYDDMGLEYHDLLKRQTSNGTNQTVYISANTCVQPHVNLGGLGSPPQLTLYVSSNESDITSTPIGDAMAFPFDQGYVSVQVNATGDVFFAVVADNLTTDFSGQWNYKIAASIDASYFYYEGSTPMIWSVDTDSKSALLATLNLTDPDINVSNTKSLRQQWMDMIPHPPFTMKVYNASSPNLTGIERSYCGLDKLDINPVTINYNMTTRGVGKNPKQQFYATGLQPGQNYTAILAFDGVNMTNSSVVAGGGQLWQSIPFTTKTEDNCKIIYDLPFCDAVAYAVPTNPNNPSLTIEELRGTYDNYSSSLYQNFTNSLDQIQCHTAESSQYSLATNCDECKANYKLWLCAVTIPRCEDFSNTVNSALKPRNIGHPFPNGTTPVFTIQDPSEPRKIINSPESLMVYNSSRNPMIDEIIKPGPYKELLPCQELCFDLVQACPTALGFQCPKAEGYAGGVLRDSYGTYNSSKVNVNDFVTCNFLGVDWPSLSRGARVSGGGGGLLLWLAVGVVLVFAA